MNRLISNFFILIFCAAIFACSPENVSNDSSTNTPEVEDTDAESNEEEHTDNSGEENPNEEEANTPPSENFDLSQWNLSIPVFESNGTATDVSTTSLLDGYENESYFYTSADDNAMVFKNFVEGAKTSVNTKYTRSELREMIYGTRYDNESGLSTKDYANNWVFSSSDQSFQNMAGAVDGELTATVKINHVTTTGDNDQVGRVIIGQIHASEDEPCRLYYRKLPNNPNGSIYFAHEPTDETGLSEQWHEMIGSRSSSATSPADGIALNEVFSYSIKVIGNSLTVTIFRDGKDDVSKTIDMTNSGFKNDWMYFKAGVYTQNNTGDATDYDEVSFYQLEITH